MTCYHKIKNLLSKHLFCFQNITFDFYSNKSLSLELWQNRHSNQDSLKSRWYILWWQNQAKILKTKKHWKNFDKNPKFAHLEKLRWLSIIVIWEWLCYYAYTCHFLCLGMETTLKEPSPDIVLASALKNKKRSSHKVGGALRGLTMTSSDLETGKS